MRVKLSEKYKTEREDICNKLLSIIELDSNNSFLLDVLDNDVEKQTAILNMKDEIQKYFACSGIASFKPGFDCKRPYLSVVRGILRNQGYTFISSDAEYRTPEGLKRTVRYVIFRNN